MTSGNRSGDDTVTQRSGWLIPLAVFVITAILSILFLLFYLFPRPTSLIEESQSFTPRADLVRLSVGGLSLEIPANYLLYASARQGGPRRQVDLFAKYPDFSGYSDWESRIFAGSGTDSPIIYMLIREDPFNLTEVSRLKRVYLSYVVSAAGKSGPFGLLEYAFREDSAYRGEDLFVGWSNHQVVVMRCERLSLEDPSPSCLRDMQLSKGAALTYRFKRSHLANWHEIADGARMLVVSFQAHNR